MRIQHNIMAMNAYRNYTNNVSAMKKNLEKLSSGYKINRAGDDAAGLAISEKMRAQITGLQQAQANAKSGINLVQTAEGALTEVHDMLNRMIKLADQSANGTYDNTTDRDQLQKEVKQLLDEINRIADSSNFNGINLLDGTLGLNTDAFEVGKTAVDATEAKTAATLAGADILASIHGGESATFQNAEFVIDLADIKGTYETGGKFTIKVAGATLTVAATATKTAATAGDIGAMFAKKYTGSASANAVEIGGAKFKVTHATGKLTFTQIKGSGTATKYKATATAVSASVAKTINAALKGASVEVAASGKAAVNTPYDYDHAIQDVQLAVAEESGGKWGADIDLSKIVANGNTLTIGSKTFTFKMSAADSTVSGNDIKLDSRLSASKQVEDAVRLLSQNGQFPTKLHISAKDGKTIHVDAAATDTYADKATFLKDVKAVVAGQAAKGAGVELKVTDSEIKDGNTLNIDGKKFVFNTKGAAPKGATATDVTYLKISDGIDGLKTALTAAGYDVTKDNDKLTIRTAVKAGADPLDTKAPVILGKGLTLQIGDTSDDFNQLNVAVQDMHTWSLGIAGLDISTEEAAQAAVDKIKAAINVVSDVRGTLGATQNRLDHTINNLSVMTENIQDAESTIRDTDVAEEMMAYTKNNILIQSAQAMLAQANQVPQGVLQLLQ